MEGGSALLDTGIFCFAGAGWKGLLAAAAACSAAACGCLGAGAVSLYGDLAGAMVPGCHQRLAERPLGPELLDHLGAIHLRHHAAPELSFLHFGTQAEVTEHLASAWQGRLGRRLHARCGADVAREAVILESDLDAQAPVGGGSLVVGCRLGPGWSIGRRATPCAVPPVPLRGARRMASSSAIRAARER